MGTRLGNFKSKLRYLIGYSFSRKGVAMFPDKISYYNAFKNHAVLMEAYGTVLKNALNTPDIFCRNKFVESHVYKKLRSLRKIYLVEIAALYDPDNNILRSTLNKLVEDIDKFLSNLFYFPTITLKGIILTIIAAIAVIYQLRDILLPIAAGSKSIFLFLGVYLGAYLGVNLVLFLGLALFSFIDKRLLFIIPEYKLQGHFDKWKKMWKAFLGNNIEGTIYEKENKLFDSLKMRKNIEPGVDILLLYIIIFVALVILEVLLGVLGSFLTFNQFIFTFYLLFLLSPIPVFLFMAKRKAK